MMNSPLTPSNPVGAVVSLIPSSHVVAVAARLICGELNFTVPAAKRALDVVKEVGIELRDLAERVFDFSYKDERAAAGVGEVVSYLKSISEQVGVLSLAEPSAESGKVIKELIVEELQRGSLRELTQSSSHISEPLHRFITALMEISKSGLKSIAHKRPLVATLVAMQAGEAFANRTMEGLLGKHYEGTFTALAQAQSEIRMASLTSIIGLLCPTEDQLALLEKQLEQIPIESKRNRDLPGFASEVAPLHNTIVWGLEICGAIPRIIENLRAIRATGAWAETVSRYSGKHPGYKAGGVSQELEFGACDTGVVFMGPSSKDAAVVTFQRAVNIATVSHSAPGGDFQMNLDATTTDGSKFTIKSERTNFVDSNGTIFPEPLVRYSKAAQLEGPAAEQLRQCTTAAAGQLSALWADFPSLFTETTELGPIFIVIEDKRRFLLVPAASSAAISRILQCSSVEQDRCDKFVRVSNLVREGGWSSFEIRDLPKKTDPIAENAATLEPKQRLYQHFRREGLPTYPEFISILKKFGVVEARSEGKGSHGALFRESGTGLNRYTTCTSIRSRTEPLRFHIILDILKKFEIPPDDLLSRLS